MDNSSLFTEQAEYIPPDSFVQWSSDHPREDVILKKLTQAGAKLLSGPRGCGKTTLMLKAYNSMIRPNSSGAFPVYVNFKASLKLEPVYKTKANGGFWFSQWMYLKIYEGIYKTLKEFNFGHCLTIELKTVQNLIALLELGEIDQVQLQLPDALTVYKLEDELNKLILLTKKTRCVLLLDDAAHAFSPEQQRDFFEFFRKIKSRIISPKAAIYPGVTNFAPTFNIGHDAEEVNAWVNPEDENYLLFMIAMLTRRLPQPVVDKLNSQQDLLKIMCFSAFGIPRVLLNMVRSLYIEQDDNGVIRHDISLTRNSLLPQIKISYKSTFSVYQSLDEKLPTYKNYITSGSLVYSRIIEIIKTYNKTHATNRKSIILAVKRELSSDLKRIFGFYQYAGLISYKGQVSKGEKGVFELFIVNLAALIDNNAILVTKAPNTQDLALALESRHAHSYTRIQPDALLDNVEGGIRLSMPPCQSCGAERSSDKARFCENCGAPLKATSIFETLTLRDISMLALTETRIKAIKKHSSIRTVKDILNDIGHTELRSVPQIGEYWATRIFYLAEEYIS